MSAEPQLFRINPENRESEKITEVDFARLGFQERRDIQEWVAANPGILGESLLIIGKEFSGFDRTNERLDLLAVDEDGKLVIIELKRDHTGADAHWQAIKYASYIHRARREDIIRVFADHADISESEAVDELLQHLGADDLDGLNNDQRIILASHRFAPEVTSASLWLNEKTPDEDLITCVQLIPYHDPQTDSLFIQANTIIPMPGVEEYSIGIGDSLNNLNENTKRQSDLGLKLRNVFQRNRSDEVTAFLRKVASLATNGLPEEVRPNITSRWAGISYQGKRYYRLWYRGRGFWGNSHMHYFTALYPDRDDSTDWRVDVGFDYYRKGGKRSRFSENAVEEIQRLIEGANVHGDHVGMEAQFGGVTIPHLSKAMDDTFAEDIANTLRSLIEEITPAVDELFEDEYNAEQD